MKVQKNEPAGFVTSKSAMKTTEFGSGPKGSNTAAGPSAAGMTKRLLTRRGRCPKAGRGKYLMRRIAA